MENNKKFKISIVLCLSFTLLIGTVLIFSQTTQRKLPSRMLKSTYKKPVQTIKKEVGFKPVPKCFKPRHKRGDKDFAGNGPHVSCKVEIKLNKKKDELLLYIKMYARETIADYTTASSDATWVIYHAPAGWTINRILTPCSSEKNYTDTDHLEDIFHMGNYDLVNKYSFVGDTRGDESGSKTRVCVYFNTVKLEISRPIGSLKAQMKILYPGTRTFIPPHVGKGDKDFKGNGPNIYCRVQLNINRGTRDTITYTIFMDAKETKSDWTQARGSKTFHLYTAQPGEKIIKIQEGYISQHRFTDTHGSLSMDVHTDKSFYYPYGPVSGFIFSGDSRGDDIGKTKVVVRFRPLHVHLTKTN